MSRAVVPRMQGDDYQARYFWLYACDLLLPHSKVKAVWYENEAVKSFDDIVVEYKEPIRAADGQLVTTDYFQVKFRATQAGSITFDALMDPAFINAKSVSILQRLKDAVMHNLGEGHQPRFTLVLPWQVHPDDPLSKCLSNEDGSLRLDKLFDGTTTDMSTMGKIRSAWRNHLKLNTDDELKSILRRFRIEHSAPTLERLWDQVNNKLYLSGLKPTEKGILVNPYDDLIKKLFAQGINKFDALSLKECCVREGQWVGLLRDAVQRTNVGIRSFFRRAENMEHETGSMLCLLNYFDERQINESRNWNVIVQRLDNFLSENLAPEQSYALHLDTHSSIAFTAGYFLDSKSGIDVAPVQRGRGRTIWTPGRINFSEEHGWATPQVTKFNSDSPDLAVSLSVTHPIADDVRFYIEETGLNIAKLIDFEPYAGASPSSIMGGEHAWILACQFPRMLKRLRFPEALGKGMGRIHLFLAAPNAFVFFLGQLSRGLGTITIYEFDYESGGPGAYQPGITLS